MFKSLAIFLCLTVSSVFGNDTRSFDSNSKKLQYEQFNLVDKPIALLILFNGGNGDPRRIDEETKINEVATQMNLQCIGVPQGEWVITDSVYNNIKQYVTHLNIKYKISEGKLFMGGFSLGGFTTLRYTEKAVEHSDSLYIPKAVFTIDPPVDFEDLYNYCTRELERKCANNPAGIQEANWIKNKLEVDLGKPDSSISKYISASVYSKSDTTGGNVKYLKNIPILSFHELDLMWSVEKCRDIRDGNISSVSPMINTLQQSGNKNAKIILTQNKGYRADGTRHPHSWSIADPNLVLNWMMKFYQ